MPLRAAVVQERQAGTGDAAATARPLIVDDQDQAGDVLVVSFSGHGGQRKRRTQKGGDDDFDSAIADGASEPATQLAGHFVTVFDTASREDFVGRDRDLESGRARRRLDRHPCDGRPAEELLLRSVRRVVEGEPSVAQSEGVPPEAVRPIDHVALTL